MGTHTLLIQLTGPVHTEIRHGKPPANTDRADRCSWRSCTAGCPACLPEAGRGGPALPGGRAGSQTRLQPLQELEQGGQVRGGEDRNYTCYRQVDQGASSCYTDTDSGGSGQADRAVQGEDRDILRYLCTTYCLLNNRIVQINQY